MALVYGRSNDKAFLIIANFRSAVVSLFGALVTLWTYRAIPEILNTTRKLIICLTAAVLLTASRYMLAVIRYSSNFSSNTDSHICTTQSEITTFSSLVSFFLTVIIAIHITSTLVLGRSNASLALLIIVNIVRWTIPGIIVGVAAGNQVLGEDANVTAGTGPWCWVKTSVENNKIWMIVTGKGWEILCYMLTASIYVLLKFFLYLRHRAERFSRIQTSLRDEDKKFLYVWFILYVIRLWGTIRFFIFVADPDLNEDKNTAMQILLYMQAFGDPSQAFFNCVLFCFLDKTVREYLLSKFRQSTRQARPLLAHGETFADERNSSINSSMSQGYGTSGYYGSTASEQIE